MDKNLQNMLNELGQNYGIQTIDMEDCIYRDLGDYEIEISGCRKKNGPFSVFIWLKSKKTIVYRKTGIRSLRRLKSELNHVMELNQAREQGIKWPEEV